MLAPSALTSTQLTVALKPTAGWEKQLWASTSPSCNPGVVSLVAVNSGVYQSSVADNTILAGTPLECVALLRDNINGGGLPIVLNFSGTDSNALPVVGVATFTPPSYVQMQEFVFPAMTSVDILMTTGGASGKWATINFTSATYNGLDVNVPVEVWGFPSFNSPSGSQLPASAPGAYRLIGTKMDLKYNQRVPMPHAVQDGRDLSAFIKKGEIQIGDITVKQKVRSEGDGLMRLNGVPCTGLIREIKEGQVETSRTYLPQLDISSTTDAPESVQDVTADGKGIYKVSAVMVAH